MLFIYDIFCLDNLYSLSRKSRKKYF